MFSSGTCPGSNVFLGFRAFLSRISYRGEPSWRFADNLGVGLTVCPAFYIHVSGVHHYDLRILCSFEKHSHHGFYLAPCAVSSIPSLTIHQLLCSSPRIERSLEKLHEDPCRFYHERSWQIHLLKRIREIRRFFTGRRENGFSIVRREEYA